MPFEPIKAIYKKFCFVTLKIKVNVWRGGSPEGDMQKTKREAVIDNSPSPTDGPKYNLRM